MSSLKRTANQSLIRQTMYQSSTSRFTSMTGKKGEEYTKKTVDPLFLYHDENGIDLTPLPLLSDDKKVKEGDKDTPSDNISQGSFYTQSISSFIGTNPVPVTRSKSQQSSSGFTAETSSSMSDEIGDDKVQHIHMANFVDVNRTASPEKGKAPVKDSNLNCEVNIYLSETDTIWIFDRAPELYPQDFEDSAIIEERNKKYQQLLNDRVGNDKYVERGMNTFENARISKTVQTQKIGTNDFKQTASVWNIYDTFNELQEKEQAERAETKDENLVDPTTPFGTTTGTVQSNRPAQQPQQTGPNTSVTPPVTPYNAGGMASRTPTAADRLQESISTHSESDLFGTRQSTATPTMAMDSQARNEEIMKSDNLLYSLFIMERALNMNSYFDKMIHYRNLPHYPELMRELKAATAVTPIPQSPQPQEPEFDNENIVPGTLNIGQNGIKSDKESLKKKNEQAILQESNLNLLSYEKDRPYLATLWRFSIGINKNRNISSLAWNKHNPDIISAGYGEFEYNKQQKKGLVCCWSLKNIDYPERILKLDSGVTALSWSKTHACLLAVGMFDGTISVFDMRYKTNESLIDTKHSAGRHIGPVRQLEWVVRVSGRSEENSEVLISISSDGRVTQWSVRKGFESSDLMKLKRVAPKIPLASKQKKTDALISQFAAGCSMDFNGNDSNIYLVGLEDGNIHKCSCSYNEQYLDNYFGHTAPVYTIKWSPFDSDIFLTCSADWSIKLWKIDSNLPVLSIQSSVKAVNSLCWSPKSSVVFACVNESAVEVWNFAVSTLDPVVTENLGSESTVLTTITFTDTGDCLLVGDSDGVLHTLRLGNMPDTPRNQAEALDRIVQSCVASQL